VACLADGWNSALATAQHSADDDADNDEGPHGGERLAPHEVRHLLQRVRDPLAAVTGVSVDASLL
jgi:hypothetical protein